MTQQRPSFHGRRYNRSSPFPKLVSCPWSNIKAFSCSLQSPSYAGHASRTAVDQVHLSIFTNSRLRFAHAYASMSVQIYPNATATSHFLVFDFFININVSVTPAVCPRATITHKSTSSFQPPPPSPPRNSLHVPSLPPLHMHWSSRTISSHPSQGKRSATGRKRRPCSTSTGPV